MKIPFPETYQNNHCHAFSLTFSEDFIPIPGGEESLPRPQQGRCAGSPVQAQNLLVSVPSPRDAIAAGPRTLSLHHSALWELMQDAALAALLSVINGLSVCSGLLGPFVTLSDSTINKSDSPKVLRRKRQETQIVCCGTTLLSKTLGQEKRYFFSNNAAGETDNKKNSNSTVKPFTKKIIMIPIYTLLLLFSLLTL